MDRLGQCEEPWNTDSDLPWRVRDAVADLTPKSQSCWPVLTKVEATRTLRRVEEHIASRED